MCKQADEFKVSDEMIEAGRRVLVKQWLALIDQDHGAEDQILQAIFCRMLEVQKR